jgi:hypothetical protein
MDYKIGFGGQARDLCALSCPLTVRGRIVLTTQNACARMKERVQAHPRLFSLLRSFVRACKRIKPHS